MKKVVKVFKQVGIHDFINNLPKKYETILSEKISNIRVTETKNRNCKGNLL